jgi:hypothetical protein
MESGPRKYPGRLTVSTEAGAVTIDIVSIEGLPPAARVFIRSDLVKALAAAIDRAKQLTARVLPEGRATGDGGPGASPATGLSTRLTG